MRSATILAAVLAMVGWISPVTDCRAADEADAAAIQGTWEIVNAEIGGQLFPVEAFNKAQLVLKDGTYELAIDKGEYKLLDVDGKKGIDVIGKSGPNEGKTFPAIYEIKGDSMKICYDLAGMKRPAKFETEKGTRQFLATYKRVSK